MKREEDEKIDIIEFLKVEVTNVILTERNKPNMRLMAQALINLRKESSK